MMVLHSDIGETGEHIYLLQCEQALHRQGSLADPIIRLHLPLPQTMTQVRVLNRWLEELYRKTGEDKRIGIYFRGDELLAATTLK